ncbi:AAA family ATPase [Nocardia lijiangensis]|uniref:bifunctional aminoglycoside phosphotransferase/ATP-binding protein n=1 Tax=Nocardia lijiangensis TaxID=299618 RepID=UPI0008367512|nr:AAA family ATPase [Nocardia lijiangensis]
MAGNTGPGEVRETHAGLVLLYGERAYKVKKAVRTDFLDFSTPQLRERACARELELNRRLAPDVYLGLAHLSDPEGGPGEPVLVMRRMPESSRLSNLLADPAKSVAELSALVRVVAEFHRGARRGPDIDAEGTPDALRRRWQALVSSLAEQPAEVADPELVARTSRLAMRYLDGRAPLLAARIAEGCVLDGHGDLQAEDIFELADGFRVLDCLDFDDRLRYVDRLDDIAFLAMDLEFRGHPELARRLLDDYQQLTTDTAPASLRDHYVAYRALVRAKVDTIRFEQGEQNARERLHRHLLLALQHLQRAAVRLVLIGGLPGTGKSTVSRELSAATGAVVISSDQVRKQLLAAGEITGEIGTFGVGAYSAAGKARVYAELRTRARELLAAGRSVILDASWTDSTEQRQAAALAAEARADLVQLVCHCPPSVAGRRIDCRPRGDSDATRQIAAAMAGQAAEWPDATVIDTALSLPDTVAAARREWDNTDGQRSRGFGHQSEAQLRPDSANTFVR